MGMSSIEIIESSATKLKLKVNRFGMFELHKAISALMESEQETFPIEITALGHPITVTFSFDERPQINPKE